MVSNFLRFLADDFLTCSISAFRSCPISYSRGPSGKEADPACSSNVDSISAAASVICLDLFQRNSPAETLREERAEVEIGLATLRRMASFSGIASRGAALIQNLLEEEAKLPALETAANEARPSKRRRLSAGAPTDIPVSHHDAPRHRQEAAALQTAPSAPSGGFLPTVLLASPSSSATAQLPASSDPFLNFDTSSLMTTTAALSDSLPAEFVSAFLESGFDPLDGAITALQDFNWPLLAPTTPTPVA